MHVISKQSYSKEEKDLPDNEVLSNWGIWLFWRNYKQVLLALLDFWNCSGILQMSVCLYGVLMFSVLLKLLQSQGNFCEFSGVCCQEYSLSDDYCSGPKRKLLYKWDYKWKNKILSRPKYFFHFLFYHLTRKKWWLNFTNDCKEIFFSLFNKFISFIIPAS